MSVYYFTHFPLYPIFTFFQVPLSDHLYISIHFNPFPNFFWIYHVPFFIYLISSCVHWYVPLNFYQTLISWVPSFTFLISVIVEYYILSFEDLELGAFLKREHTMFVNACMWNEARGWCWMQGSSSIALQILFAGWVSFIEPKSHWLNKTGHWAPVSVMLCLFYFILFYWYCDINTFPPPFLSSKPPHIPHLTLLEICILFFG